MRIKMPTVGVYRPLRVWFLLSVVVYFSLSFVCGDRTRQKIYVEIPAIHACFRRLNGTHQIGCQSERSGNVGVLHYISNKTSLDWLLTTGPHSPYIALLEPLMFNVQTVELLRGCGKVTGILVIHTENSTEPPSFSPDQTCPNNKYGMYAGDTDYADCRNGTWNDVGQGLMFHDFNLPIIAVTNSSNVQTLIHQCYEKYNAPGQQGAAPSYPLCAAEVKDRMDAAKDSETCIRRSNLLINLNPVKYCDPLGDYNSLASLRAVNHSETRDNRSVIIASARLDSFSLFENLYPSADSSVTGLVALLSAAEVIGKVKAEILESQTDILFTVFNGEAFDYIGSSRAVYDMVQRQFPVKPASDADPALITLQNIQSFLEVGQVGLHDNQKQVWMHTDPLSLRDEDVKAEVNKLEAVVMAAGEGLDLGVSRTPQVAALPPASVQSFLKKSKIPAIVISNHKTQFANKFYNSRFDLARYIEADYPAGMPANETYDYITAGARHIQQVATLVARSLYTMSTGKTNTSHLEADNKTIANLLNCFLFHPNCDLFLTVTDANTGSRLEKITTPLPFYVGVATSTNWVTSLTHSMLAYYLGDKPDYNQSMCKSDPKDKVTFAVWVQGRLNTTSNKREGQCVLSTARLHQAVSPAFSIRDYNWKSGEFSTWTESVWQNDAISVRAFLKPSLQQEVLTLCLGLLILLASLPLVYIINKRAHFLFNKSVYPDL